MNIIVIDDMMNIVDSIAEGVNWERLQIGRVFKANNSAEARTIIRENHVDIMICDIEMPQESGLELFEWAGKNYPDIECIFLTSHSKFDYAKKAVTLGSFDYLLKPIQFDELEAAIEKVMIKICIDRKISSESRYWQENILKIQEKFWYDLLHGVYKNDKQKISSVAETCSILNIDDNKFRLILIHTMQNEMTISNRTDYLLRADIIKAIAELLGVKTNELQAVLVDPDELMIIKKWNSKETDYHLKSILELFIQQSFREFNSSIDIYVSGSAQVSELPEISSRMIEKVDENVADYKKVFFLDSDENTQRNKLEIRELGYWKTLLMQGNNEKAVKEIINYINSLVRQRRMNSEIFTQIHSQIFEMINKDFAEKQINAYTVFSDKDIAELYLKSLNSVEKFNELIRLLLSSEILLKNQELENKISDDSITRIKTHIRNNLENELSRQELANRVFLNPEYLSRLFKKKTGISLTEFIKNERMNTAKYLLCKTDMPVSIIASKVGYSNFSHFSQVFKQHTGISPASYRKST